MRARLARAVAASSAALVLACAGAGSAAEPVAGPVEIGDGRTMYVTCHGTGAPTIVLVAGLRGSAEDWNITEGTEPTVFAEVAGFARVCAYDRPGTPVGEAPSRSDPVAQPVTAADGAADLEALLRAIGGAGPFVLVGHSYGGLIVRLFAGLHPEDVAGIVLIDALSEGLQDAETAAEWEVQRGLLNGDLSEALQLYPPIERIDPDRSFAQMRAAPPLPQVPLIVLSADQPIGPLLPALIADGTLPADTPPDFGYVVDAAQWQAQQRLAELTPNARHITDTNSGHEIQKHQPQLVIDAIRAVVDAARDPSTW